jgi:hypothetical protein
MDEYFEKDYKEGASSEKGRLPKDLTSVSL